MKNIARLVEFIGFILIILAWSLAGTQGHLPFLFVLMGQVGLFIFLTK